MPAAGFFLIDYYEKIKKNPPLKRGEYFRRIKKSEGFFCKVQIFVGTILKDSLFMF